MAQIVITEFMADNAVEWLRAHHSVVYDPSLGDDHAS